MITGRQSLHKFLALFCALMIVLAESCCIHEDPRFEEPEPPAPPERPFTLSLEFDTDLPMLGEYIYENGVTAKSRASGPEEAIRQHDVRYIINAFPISRAGEISRSSDTTIVVTRPFDGNLNTTMKLDIPTGDYRLYVWADYVDKGSSEDKYYVASDFEEILLNPNREHSGSNPWRDAFIGSIETSVLSRAEDGTPSRTPIDGATIQMARPMAVYRFVSTDLERFIEQASRNEAAARADESRDPSRAPSLSDYKVRFTYSRYMPNSFNVFTNKPADSKVGVTFESNIEKLNDKEAQIGFDHVFVNGNATSVSVAVQVLDKNGNELARIPSFEVPLKRSKLTIVKGEFLTTKSDGAIGINPGFDDEFNIEIIK